MVEASYALYDYMTDRAAFTEIREELLTFPTLNVSKEKLAVSVLDELLFLFSCEPFMVAKRIEVVGAHSDGGCSSSNSNNELQLTLFGEPFIPGKHPNGTEVKAITSSNIRVELVDSLWHIWVIFDI